MNATARMAATRHPSAIALTGFKQAEQAKTWILKLQQPRMVIPKVEQQYAVTATTREAAITLAQAHFSVNHAADIEPAVQVQGMFTEPKK